MLSTTSHTSIGVLVFPDPEHPEQAYAGLVLRKSGREKAQRDGKVYREDRRWKFPGGGCEEGESHLECMIREVRGEAGLVIDEHHVLTMFDADPRESSRPGADYHQSHWFLVELNPGIPSVSISEADEIERFRLFQIKDIPSLADREAPMTLSHLQALRNLLREAPPAPWVEPMLREVENKISYEVTSSQAA